MKIRTDFVSNSSSSSFVVRIDENLPDVFKKYVDNTSSYVKSWEDFQQGELADQIVNAFNDKWYDLTEPEVAHIENMNEALFNAVKFISDEQFASQYTAKDPTNTIDELRLPESSRQYVKPFIDALLTYSNLHYESTHCNIVKNHYLTDDKYDKLDTFACEIMNYLDTTYFIPHMKSLTGAIGKVLSPICSQWKFICVDIDDSDIDENFECEEDRAWEAIEQEGVWGYGISLH